MLDWQVSDCGLINIPPNDKIRDRLVAKAILIVSVKDRAMRKQ